MRKRPNDVEKLDQISQSINSDGQGNLTVNKNLGVDGKLTLKSLVSATNPDGDITKELGGGGGGSINLYRHCIRLVGTGNPRLDIISFNLYNTNSAKLAWTDIYTYAKTRIACSGYAYHSGTSTCYFANTISFNSNGTAGVYAVNADWSERIVSISRGNYRVDDYVEKVQ